MLDLISYIDVRFKGSLLTIINFYFLYSDWPKTLLQLIGDSFVIEDVGGCLSKIDVKCMIYTKFRFEQLYI